MRTKANFMSRWWTRSGSGLEFRVLVCAYLVRELPSSHLSWNIKKISKGLKIFYPA